VAAARDFLARLLAGQPGAGTTVLLASELVANSVLHSASGRDGGTVTLTVLHALPGGLRIEVTDDGGPAVPLVRDPADLAPGGRGLRLVDALSARWGFYRAGPSTVTWFETAP
jgi:anti-sigma regulatory factor (Ser/Thr protein kinase)